MPDCRICHSDIEPFIDFGRMPLANGFLTPDQFAADYYFNLSAAYCPRCTLVQLVEQPQRERMFNDRYPFFSATSARMAAHFARLNMPGRNVPSTDNLFQSFDISDRVTGTYDLSTTTGNRPPRVAPGGPGTQNVTPEYRETLAKPRDGNWRAAFAESLIQDPMFATNFVNRFWREFFGMGLVEPYDMLDPLRLDPGNPPPAPWTLQATHPAKQAINEGCHLRSATAFL